MKKFCTRVFKSLLRLLITFTIIVLISSAITLYDFEYEYNRIVDMEISTANYKESVKGYFIQISQGDLGSFTYTDYGSIYNKNHVYTRPISADILEYFKTTATTFMIVSIYFRKIKHRIPQYIRFRHLLVN